ncbi:retrotransposon protein, putative, ty1-copia subclass [Tanacetum coccineum]
MLGIMTLKLQRHENLSPYDMLHELKFMFEKQAGVERFDLIRTFHACKQEEGKSISSYVLKMKSYVEQLERLSYVLPQDIIVSLILNGLTSNFTNFVRNYNMHNMGKIIGELHALLIEYEKGLPKKAAIPQVLAIQGGRIQKSNKKPQAAKGKGKGKGKGKNKLVYASKPKNPIPDVKEHPTKDDSCHHCKEGERKLRQGVVYFYVSNGVRAQVEAIGSLNLVLPNGLVICLDNFHYAPTITRGVVSVYHLVDDGFIQRFTDSGILVSNNDVLYFNDIPNDVIYEIDMLNLVPNVNSIYNVSNKRAKINLEFTYLWHCCLAHISKKHIEKLQHDGLLKSTNDESFDQCALRSDRGGEYISQEFKDYLKACGIFQQLTPLYIPQHNGVSGRRNRTLLDMVQSMINLPTLSLSFWDYALESATRILNMVPTNKFDKTPYELYGRAVELEEIQDENTSPSENTSENLVEVESFKPPEEDVALVHPKSNKWLNAMNAKMQSMKDNQVWRLVDLPPNGKTVGSKCLFKKKADMDGNIHTYKTRLVAKGYTQTYRIDYKETFSPVAYIRAIRILIAIAAFYDYKIWQMEVKTALLKGYLDEDIYMVQPEGFIDSKHPMKVYKLQRSIYELKQASRSWNKIFDVEIKKFGFAQNLDEPCIYQKASRSNVTFLILYVDDIIIMGNDIPMLQSVKSYIGKCFAMKDLGEAAFILGIKIYRDRSKRLIRLSQRAYMDKILKRFRMDNSKRGNIPVQEPLDLNKTQGASTPEEVKRMQNVPYASVVGSIMYAVRCTRPDVAFAQNITSHF